MKCFFCGSPSTHICTSCGHPICDSPICGQKAKNLAQPTVRQQARFAVQHPIRAARIGAAMLSTLRSGKPF
jgi:hypothetical protein